MTPIGSGLATNADPAITAFTPPLPHSAQSLFVESGATIYRQQRASKVGDIVTVNIAINDQATLGNNTARSTTAGVTGQADWSLLHSGSSKDDASCDVQLPGPGQYRPIGANPGFGRHRRHRGAPQRQSSAFRFAGSPCELRASPPDRQRPRVRPGDISTATMRSPTTRSPRRAFRTAAAAGSMKSSSRPGASRSGIVSDRSDLPRRRGWR